MDALKKAGAQIKSGAENVGAHVKSGVESGYKEVSHGIRDTKDSAQILADNMFHHGDHEFAVEEKLIEQYKRGLSQYVSGIKFVNRSVKRLAVTYWPQLFRINLRIARNFHNIVADIQFKGIDEYYAAWDEQQKYEIIPQVDPHQKFDLIRGVNEQQEYYERTIEKLAMQIGDEWDSFYSDIHQRIHQVTHVYISRARKLCKLWYKKRMQYDKVRRRIDKLGKKQGELDENEKMQLTELEGRLDHALGEFNRVQSRINMTLPNLVEFLDEFTDEISKQVSYQNLWSVRLISEELSVFSVHYGLVDSPKTVQVAAPPSQLPSDKFGNFFDIHGSTFVSILPSYEEIETDWSTSFEPAKFEIEKIVSETDDVDDKPVEKQVNKYVNKFHKSVTNHKWHYKYPEGLFNVELESDPLDTFLEYFDSNINRSDTYYPSKTVERHRSSIVDIDIDPPRNEMAPPPPLPPREKKLPPLPSVDTTYVPLPPPLPLRDLPPTPSPPRSPVRKPLPPPRPSRRRRDSALSLESTTFSDDSEDNASSEVSSLNSDDIIKASQEDQLRNRLVSVYNRDKNFIGQCPIPQSKNRVPQFKPTAVNDAYKLTHLQLLFEKYADSDSTPRMALYSFHGTEPGDLSFKKGDTVDVVLDLQNVNATYTTGDNWVIARQDERMGFAPANYLG